jgi:hypothetical protein
LQLVEAHKLAFQLFADLLPHALQIAVIQIHAQQELLSVADHLVYQLLSTFQRASGQQALD